MNSFDLKNWHYGDVQIEDSLNQNIEFSSTGHIHSQRGIIAHIFLKTNPYGEVIYKEY